MEFEQAKRTMDSEELSKTLRSFSKVLLTIISNQPKSSWSSLSAFLHCTVTGEFWYGISHNL